MNIECNTESLASEDSRKKVSFEKTGWELIPLPEPANLERGEIDLN